MFITFTMFRSPAQEVYLIMRNVAISLWYKDCNQLVTVDKCMNILRLRGIVRIWCYVQYPRVLHFLSRRGYINVGMLPHPLNNIFPNLVKKVQISIGCRDNK